MPPPPAYRHLVLLFLSGHWCLDELSPGADTAVAINRHRCMCGADASGIGGSGMWDSVERLEQEREVRKEQIKMPWYHRKPLGFFFSGGSKASFDLIIGYCFFCVG